MKTNSYLESIYEVSQAVDHSGDPYWCCELTLEKIAALGLRNGMIKIMDHDPGVVGGGEVINDHLRIGIIDRVSRKGKPLIAVMDSGESGADGNTVYYICVPVRYDHVTMAVLAAEHENAGEDDLENDLQLLSILASLLVAPIKQIISGSGSEASPLRAKNAKLPLTRMVENFERKLIIEALRKTMGNQTKAAALLGVSLRIINYRIGKLNLDYRRFRKVG
jgi:transcriptional regulator with GAF, ATPase, and Fis domain